MSTGAVVVGIDIGTGGVRATAMDVATGAMRARASASLTTPRSADGARMQNPQEWLSAVCRVTREVVDVIGDRALVRCVGLTSAAHNAVVVLRGHSEPLDIVLWSDARPNAELRTLPNEVRREVREHARVELDSTWTLVQLRWLARQHGANWDPAEVHLGHGYLVSWLTGEHVTDPSTAAGTGFYDPVAKSWNEQLVKQARLAPGCLPRVTSADTVVGAVSVAASQATGLERGTPVIAGGTDTACELLAAGMVGPGSGLVKAATSGTAVTVVDVPIDNQRTLIYPHVVGDGWYLVSPTSSAWSSVSWMSAMLGADVVELAKESTPGSGGLTFLPHLDGERVPLWRRDASGLLAGLRSHHSRADIARAVLEGVSFSLADALDYLESVLGHPLNDLRFSGGGLQNPEAASILASAIGRPARIANLAEPSRGAALLARIGITGAINMPEADESGGVWARPQHDLTEARARYHRRQRSMMNEGPM